MLAFARPMIGQGVQHPAGLPIGLTVAMGSMGCLLQRDQFGNGVEVKTELPGMGDKGQPVQLGMAVAALPPSVRPGSGKRPRP